MTEKFNMVVRTLATVGAGTYSVGGIAVGARNMYKIENHQNAFMDSASAETLFYTAGIVGMLTLAYWWAYRRRA